MLEPTLPSTREAIKEQIKEQIVEGVKGSIGGALGSALLSGPADPVAGYGRVRCNSSPCCSVWYVKMSDNIQKMSDDTQVAMPIRNIISIVAGVAVATWAYSGVIERLNKLETNSQH